MACTLKINGSAVDRSAGRFVLDRLNLAVGDGYDTLEFSQRPGQFPAAYRKGWAVELVDDDLGTLFKGRIVSRHYLNVGRGPIRIGYRAFGLEWLANRIRVTAPDGTGRLAFNMPRTDDDYTPGAVGLSVGAILKRLFDLHETQLAAVGVTGYTEAELDALTVVPPEAVYLSGGLIQMARAQLEQWCNKYTLWIDNADGTIHVANQLEDLAPLTLTFDEDPFLLESLSEDSSECASRVVYRGGPDVQAAYLDFNDDLLEYGWTSTAEGDWTYADYLAPGDSADLGDVTGQTSDTLTVKSDSASRTWAANYWNGVGAEVVAYNPAASGIEFSEARRITACGALTAGGSTTLTVDEPFNNSGYTRYSIRGLSSEGASVWRKLLIKNEYVARHLVKQFSHSTAWAPMDGFVTQTTTPQASICYSSGCSQPYLQWPATFDVVLYDGETDGYLMFHEPIVKPFSSRDSLVAGDPDGIPCDVKVLVPYSRGALTATAPASGYEGTSYTTDELQQTLYVDDPSWLDYRDATMMAQLAQEVLDTVKNTVCEGTLTYFGKLSGVLAKGVALNLAHPDATCGFESMGAMVRSVVLDFNPDGGAATEWTTSISFSNRLKPFSGDRLYRHPAFGSARALGDARLDMSGGGRAIAAQVQASAMRPDAGYQGPLTADGSHVDWKTGKDKRAARDQSPSGNTYRGPRKNTGIDAPELSAALGNDPQRDNENARDRRAAQRATQEKSDQSAARLSYALGNPSRSPGKDATPDQLAQHEKDREIDAELRRIAEGADGGSTNTSGPGLSYR